MNRYFYSLDDQSHHGPVTWETLRALVVAGQIKPHHYVFADGSSQWTEARDIPGLIPADALDPPSPDAHVRGQSRTGTSRPRLRPPNPGPYAATPKATVMPLARGLYGPPEPCPMRYRIAAFATDATIGATLFVVLLPVTFYLARPILGQTVSSETALAAEAFAWLVVLPWLYSAGFECSPWSGTPGKRVLAIRVVGRRGGRVTFKRATGRHFAKALSVLPMGLGLFMSQFDTQRRAWHDRIAGTRVERTPPV